MGRKELVKPLIVEAYLIGEFVYSQPKEICRP
jgi:hypothetical protein